MLEAGADVRSNDEGFTQLMVAIVNGLESMVYVLIKAGADVNVVFPRDILVPYSRPFAVKNGAVKGQTLLMCAVNEGKESIVSALIQAGADVNARGEGAEYTALMFAVRKNHESAIRMLIEAGADVDHISYFGETALSLTREDDIARALRAESARRRRENAAAEDDEYVEFERSRSKKARRDHLSQAMTILDEHSHALPEGAYVDICRELQGAFAQHS